MVAKIRPLASQLQFAEGSHPLHMDEQAIARIFADPLYLELINSPDFQRLHAIRFLGAIDYLIHPNGRPLHVRHTRFQHSLGVGRLALRFARDLEWDSRREHTFVAAALLHDLGHCPLSHSLERMFKEHFGIDHHIATAEAIVGAERPGLSKILCSFGVNPEELLDMIGNRSGPWSSFFLGQFNVDTLDAITRSLTYLQKNSLHVPPYDVMLAGIEDDTESQSALDAFWKQKDLVYTSLIFSPQGILADHNAQDYMRRNLHQFRREHFYLNEVELKRLHPRLFSGIDRPRWDRVIVNRRRFEVDPSTSVRSHRYVERKEAFTVDFMYRAKDLGLPQPTTARVDSHDGKVSGN
jgi:hypothetical protein